MQPSEKGPSNSNRRRLARTRPILLAILLLLGFLALVVERRADDWIRSWLVHEVSGTLGGSLTLVELDLSWSRFEVTFKGIDLALAPERGHRLHVTVRSARARWTWRGLLALATGRARLAELVLDGPLVEFEAGAAAGSATPGVAGRALDVRIRHLEVHDGRLAFRDPAEPIHVQANDVELRAQWDRSRKGLAGDVSLGVGVLHPRLDRPIELDLRGSFVWRDDELLLERVTATAPGLALKAQATLGLAGGLSIAGAGSGNADLERLLPSLGWGLPPGSGNLSGTFDFGWRPDSFTLDGRFEANDASLGPWRVASGTASAHLRPGNLELVDLRARALGGSLEGTIGLDWSGATSFHGSLVGRDLAADEVLHRVSMPVPLASRVTMSLDVEGLLQQPASWRMDGRFSARPDPGRPGLPTSAEGRIAVSGERFRLEAPEVGVAAAVLGVEADLDLGTDRDGFVELTGETVDARRTQLGAIEILRALDVELPELVERPLEGCGEVRARFERGPPATVEFDLHLTDGSFAGQSFERADLALLTDPRTVTLRHLSLSRGTEQLDGEGRFALDPFSAEHLELRARDLDLAWLAGLAGVSSGATGRIDLDASVAGGAGERRGTGRVEVSRGSFEGEPFDGLTAEVVVAGDEVRLEQLSLHGPAASLSGSLAWNPGGSLRIQIDSGQVGLERIRSLRERELPLTGTVSVSGEVWIGEGKSTGQLALAGQDWAIRDLALGRITGTFGIEEGGLRIALSSPDSGWFGEAHVQLPELLARGRLELEGATLPLGRLAESSQGVFWGQVDFEGPLSEPDRISVDGQLDRIELLVAGQRLEAAEPLPIRLREGQLTAGPLHLTGLESALEAKLSYTLAEERIEASARGYLDLGVLTASMPQLRGAGRVDLRIEARGSLRAPEVSGTIVGEACRVRWLGIPQALDPLDFEVRVEGQEARLTRLTARLGNGVVEASGRLELAGFSPAAYEIQFEAANVRIAYPEGFRGIYEGGLLLSGDMRHTRLAGRVTMLQGVYDRNFDFGALAGGGRDRVGDDGTELPDVDLDVAVVADGNVWVRNEQAQIESGFDLHVGGALQQPEVTGRLWLLPGGTLVFRDVEYELTSGTLDFLELDRLNPYFTVQAETTVKNYTVHLRVEGEMEKFEYELTSDPVLSPQDIIALLTTGSTLEELSSTTSGGSSPLTGDLAANYFAGALTGRFEKQLQNALGLERVRISPLLVEGDSDPTARITLGQEVADNVLVVFSTDVGQTERQLYSVEWQAAKNIALTAEQDTLGGTGGSVRYTDRFWWSRPPTRREEARAPLGLSPPVGDIPEVEKQPVASVTISGVAVSEVKALLRRIPLSPGEPFSRSTMFRGVEVLKLHFTQADRLEAAINARSEATAEGIGVRYDIAPGPQVTLRFIGASRKEEKRLRAELEDLWVHSVFAEDLYEDAERIIRNFFEGRGHYTVDVRRRVELHGGHRVVEFAIDRGEPVRIESVVLRGMKELSEERAEALMLTRPSTLMAKRLLRPSVLAEDLAAIRSLYRDEGFLSVTIDPPSIRLSSSGDSSDIEIVIDEGPRYAVSRVEVPQDLPFVPAELIEWIDLPPGEVYSRARLLLAESRLRARLDERGYPNARVRGRTIIHESQVDVSFEIETGEVKRVAEIRILGNRLTQPKIIRRELDLEPGDLISRSELLAGQHRLYQLGIFRNVRLTYEPLAEGGSEQRVDIEVEEAPPLSTTVGAGYDTEAGPRFSFSLSDENVGGYDRAAGIQGKLSRIERRLQLVGKEPRLFGHQLSALANVGYEEREETDFTVMRRTTAVRVGKLYGPRWGGYTRYSFQRIELSEVVISPDELVELVEQEKLVEGRLGDVGVAAVRDTRDHPLLPTRGTYLTLGARLFAKPFLSEFSFVRADMSFSDIRTFRSDVSLALSVRLGLADPFGSTESVPISEAFFAGGDSTLRGFARDEVGRPGGGEGLLVLNTEARVPIWRAYNLKGVLFYDAGNVYPDASDIRLSLMRHVLGAGLRLETPIGPLRVEYGQKLDREPGESPGELFFAIGSAF